MAKAGDDFIYLTVGGDPADNVSLGAGADTIIIQNDIGPVRIEDFCKAVVGDSGPDRLIFSNPTLSDQTVEVDCDDVISTTGLNAGFL